MAGWHGYQAAKIPPHWPGIIKLDTSGIARHPPSESLPPILHSWFVLLSVEAQAPDEPQKKKASNAPDKTPSAEAADAQVGLSNLAIWETGGKVARLGFATSLDILKSLLQT